MLQPSTYLRLIAGTVPDHGQGSVDDSLRLLAQEALGTSAIHFIRSPEAVAGRYHYFALPSSVLASEQVPTTELAMALPGHPAHQGPGAYVLEAGMYRIAALFDGDQLDLVCNEGELVNDLLGEQSLPVFKVSTDVQAWRFESSYTRQSQLTERLTRRVVRVALALMTVSGLAYGALLAAEGALQTRRVDSTEAAAAMLARAVAEIKTGSPLARQLAEYQHRGSLAVRAGGWVDAYQVKGGEEHFRLFVPSWITPDYMSALGAGIAADRDPANEQLLILLKGDPVGGKKITSAETVAKPAPENEEEPADPPVNAKK